MGAVDSRVIGDAVRLIARMADGEQTVRLRERLAPAGDLVQSLASERDFRERRPQVVVERHVALHRVEPVGAVRHVGHRQRHVEMERVDAVALDDLPALPHVQLAPRLGARVEHGDPRRRVGEPPEVGDRLAGKQVSQVVGLQPFVLRVPEVHAVVAGMRHHPVAQAVGEVDQLLEARVCRVVGVVQVVPVAPPVGDVEQRLRRRYPLGQLLQDGARFVVALRAAAGPQDDDRADLVGPRRLLSRHGREGGHTPHPLPKLPRRHSPVALVEPEAPHHRLHCRARLERSFVVRAEAEVELP